MPRKHQLLRMASSSPATLGHQRLWHHMVVSGLSVADLAEKLGYTRAGVYRWLYSDAVPTSAVCKKLAPLGIEPGWFFQPPEKEGKET